MHAESSVFCPSEVDGIVPSSCPFMLFALRRQNSFSVAAPFSNSSNVQNFVGSFSTYGEIISVTESIIEAK